MSWINSTNNIVGDLVLCPCPQSEEPFADLREKITEAKSQIDGVRMWDSKKKLANPYEMISSNYRKGNVRVLYRPFSRSYFKMWEILKDYDLLPTVEESPAINVACLAEGPGGFMEAIINQRKSMKDNVIGITLPPNNEKIPGWHKLEKELVKKNRYIQKCLRVTYGNLYLLPDILSFAKKFKECDGADLVTADGGFDFSLDYNEQENMALRLIFAETVTALTVQKKGGSFVCKVFDLFSLVSVKILYLIVAHYEEVHLVKPKVSRPANSEKYIIAKGFKGIDQDLLKNLYLLLVQWNSGVMNIHGIEYSRTFIKILRKYNESFVDRQINAIENTMKLIRDKVSKGKFHKILNDQRENAMEWCRRYDVPYRDLEATGSCKGSGEY